MAAALSFMKAESNKRNMQRKREARTAWPASWYATVRRSSGLTTLLRFSRPAMTRSAAASKSSSVTASLLPRAATSAASLTTLAMSAPAKPGVSAARRGA